MQKTIWPVRGRIHASLNLRGLACLKFSLKNGLVTLVRVLIFWNLFEILIFIFPLGNFHLCEWDWELPCP
jgi:hypothetical protein